MKIIQFVILTHTDPRFDPLILKISDAAQKLGFNSKIIGVERSISTDSIVNLSLIKTFSNKLNGILPSNLRSKFPIIFGVLNLIEIYTKANVIILKNKPEITYVNDWVMLPSAVFAKFFVKSKVIYHAHELESETQGLKFYVKWLVLFIEVISWRFIDYFITVSESIKNWYLDKYGYKDNELIVNSPFFNIDSITHLTEPDMLRKIFGISGQSDIFIFVGNLDSGRGIKIILDAFSKIKNSACVIFIGDGPLLPVIESHAKYGMNIFHHKRVPYENLITLCSSGDFGICMIEDVSLSDYYSLPNKLFEYSVAGLFIIASSLPEIKNIISKYSLGVTIDSNVNSLVYWIDNESKLLKNKNSRNLNYLSVYGWGNQEKKLQSIFKSLQKL